MTYALCIALIVCLTMYWFRNTACPEGHVYLMMAPGDHCVLDKASKKCGGHVHDFSNEHHTKQCVSKRDFDTLWNAGYCHYEDGHPIINKSGYVMCKGSNTDARPDWETDWEPWEHGSYHGLKRKVAIRSANGGYYGIVIQTIIGPGYDWTRFTVNGHEMLSNRNAMYLSDASPEVKQAIRETPGLDVPKFDAWLACNEDRRKSNLQCMKENGLYH